MEPERLIAAVRERPCLWDSSNYFKAGRDKVRLAWADVCRIFNRDFDSLTDQEKESRITLIMKKWRNIRDSFTKDWRTMRGRGRLGKRCKYIFYDQLTFLVQGILDKETLRNQNRQIVKKCMKKKRNANKSISDDEDDEEEEEDEEGEHDNKQLLTPEDPSVDIDNIDPHQLIEAVESCPVIWDTRANDYRDRARTRIAWVTVCNALFPEYDQLNHAEKTNILNNVQSKWRNIRDSFMKELKGTRKKINTSRKYKYFNRLSFLYSNVDDSFCDTTIELEPPAYEIDEELFEEKYRPSFEMATQGFSAHNENKADLPQPSEAAANANLPIPTVETRHVLDPLTAPELLTLGQLEDNRNCSTRSVSPPQSLLMDADLAFFYSLLPAVKMFSNDSKLDFRMDVLKLVKKYKLEQLPSEQGSSANT